MHQRKKEQTIKQTCRPGLCHAINGSPIPVTELETKISAKKNTIREGTEKTQPKLCTHSSHSSRLRRSSSSRMNESNITRKLVSFFQINQPPKTRMKQTPRSKKRANLVHGIKRADVLKQERNVLGIFLDMARSLTKKKQINQSKT